MTRITPYERAPGIPGLQATIARLDAELRQAMQEIARIRRGGVSGGGTPGPPGPPGDDGLPGTNGEDGEDGRTILNGTGAPSSGLGVDGDFYIDTAADAIYGPKAGLSWGSPTSLIGPPGADGEDGADSTVPGPPGEDGEDSTVPGPPGADGAEGQPGGAITWVQVFDTSSTTASDPGSGLFKVNNATQNTITAVYCDDNDENAVSIRQIIGELAFSTSSTLGYLRIVEVGVPTNWLFLSVSNRVLNTGYSTITVAVEGSSAANPFADGDRCILTFTPTGEVGEQGDPGDTGPPGTGPTIFADNTARDAGFPSPVNGEQCYVQSSSTKQWFDGTGWLVEDTGWNNYTPTLTGFTVGSGTSQGRYRRHGRWVTVEWVFVFGSGSAVSTSNLISVPTGLDAALDSPFSTTNRTPHGYSVLADTGTTTWIGTCRIESATTIRVLSLNAGGNDAAERALSSTSPFTWASTDTAFIHIEYEMDDPYD